MKIEHDCLVELEYQLKNGKGEVVEHSTERGPMVYLHGHEEILPALEDGLEGAAEGEQRSICLEPDQAYGPFDPDQILSVPRSEFPADAEIVPGDWITISLSDDDDEEVDGEEMDARVLEISPDAITLDANHPLAGQQVVFEMKVLMVRKATEEEIEAREQATEEDEGG
ncbi:MAG: peptidylprolyl isomerase [Planctomycetes bacterium]|nr:peptidylprolyl isomerase [Planctomycetota bacterium]